MRQSTSAPILPQKREREREFEVGPDTVKIYHYTDEVGYRVLVSGTTEWYPSTGQNRGVDSDFGTRVVVGPAVAKLAFYRDAFATRDYENPKPKRNHDTDYGPGCPSSYKLEHMAA